MLLLYMCAYNYNYYISLKVKTSMKLVKTYKVVPALFLLYLTEKFLKGAAKFYFTHYPRVLITSFKWVY